MYRSRLLPSPTSTSSLILRSSRIRKSSSTLDFVLPNKLNCSYHKQCYYYTKDSTRNRYNSNIVLLPVVTLSSIRQDARQRITSSIIRYPKASCSGNNSAISRSSLCVQKRYYMDVHTRPSHSGMFAQKSADKSSKTTTTSSSSSNSKNDGPNFHNSNNDDHYQSPSFLSFYRTLVYRVALAIGIIHVTTEHIGDVTLCEGPSMYPTIYPSGEIIYIDKFFVKIAPYFASSDSLLSSSWIAQERIEYAQQQQQVYEQKHRKVRQQKYLEQNKPNKDSDGTSKDVDGDDDDDDDYYYWYESKISVTDIWEYWNTKMTLRQRFVMAIQHMISPLNCGDVVVLQHPTKRHGTVCKRIIGMPGDQILMLNGNGNNNGGSMKNNSSTITVVPDGHIWVEGDNPNNSSDSRNTYGCIPASFVIGRVLFRIWPFFHLFNNTDTSTTSTSTTTTTTNQQQQQHRISWMVRGTRPKTRSVIINPNTESILLPAGYEGQEINKSFKQ